MLIANGIIIFFPLAIICLVISIVFFIKATKLKKSNKCSDCGNEIKENDNICPKCGNPISNKQNKKIMYYVIACVALGGFLFSCIRIFSVVLALFNIILKIKI